MVTLRLITVTLHGKRNQRRDRLGTVFIPDWNSNSMTMEHTVRNHTESKEDHCLRPTPRETKYSVFLYQSTCNVT